MAAVSNIEINTDALSRDTGEIQTQINNIRSEMQGMFEAVQELNSMWKGEANSAFNVQFAKDYEIMGEMLQCLDKYAEALQYAQKEYCICESNVLQAIRALK